MKTLSANVVEVVMMYLIMRDGSATTLDIKNEVRSMGYKATQKEVHELVDLVISAVTESELTMEIDGENCALVIADNGKYRTLTMEVVEDEDDIELDEDQLKAQVKTFISRNPGVPSKEISVMLAEMGIDLSSRSIAAIKANMNR